MNWVELGSYDHTRGTISLLLLYALAATPRRNSLRQCKASGIPVWSHAHLTNASTKPSQNQIVSPRKKKKSKEKKKVHCCVVMLCFELLVEFSPYQHPANFLCASSNGIQPRIPQNPAQCII